MLRRFSLKFSKGRQEGPNGTSNGAERSELGRKRSSFIPQRKEKEREKLKDDTDQSANQGHVESSFQKFVQLIHASNRSLSTQTDDGIYIEHTKLSDLMQDLRSLDFKDVGTLLQVMKSKTSGQLQDDKTYLMEYVIQVRSPSTR